MVVGVCFVLILWSVNFVCGFSCLLDCLPWFAVGLICCFTLVTCLGFGLRVALFS